MDFENENILPEQEPQPAEPVLEPAEQVTTAEMEPAAEITPDTQESAVDEIDSEAACLDAAEDAELARLAAEEAAYAKRTKRRRLGMKLIKTAIAAVLVITLVFVGCSVSVILCNSYWQNEYDLLRRNMSEKVNALQQQLDKIQIPGTGSGTLDTPDGILTAAEIYKQNVSSVVVISSKLTTAGNSTGTGFVVTKDGYIVTNYHVVDNAGKITVTMSDGTTHIATLVGYNDTNDLAVIKINAIDLNPVTIGKSSDLLVGDQVIAIGNALGEFSASLTVGYVSGMDRNVTTDGTVINMIQTDVAINSGNSGGPLFNAKGEVIGITTAKYSGTTSSGATIEGIGFAIPIDDVIDMVEDLCVYGYIRSAYLGVMVWEVDADIAETYNLPLGVYVEEVTYGSCAEKAGVRPKDIIIELGGYPVRTMNELSKILRNLEAGQTVTIVVWRSGIEVIMDITLDEKPH